MNQPPKFLSRRKVVYITHAQLLRVLMGHKIFQDHVLIPQPQGLPETVVVIGMFLDPVRAAYGLNVCDESFDEIDNAVQAPELKLNWTAVRIDRPEGPEKP